MNINYFEGGAEVYHDNGVMSLTDAEITELHASLERRRQARGPYPDTLRVMREVIEQGLADAAASKACIIVYAMQQLRNEGIKPDLASLGIAYEEIAAGKVQA